METDRRRILGLLGGSFAAAALPVFAQQAGKTFRIGYLASTDPAKTPQLDGLRQGLREHGLVEGKNIAIEYLWREGALGADAAAPLARQNVDVIFVFGTPALAAAKQATSRIPIVFVGVGDPIGAGFVTNFARPGGNITGMTNNARDLAQKRLQLLAQVVPAGSRIAVLRNPANALAALELREIEPASRALGLEFLVVDVRAPEEYEAAFARASAARVAGVVVLAEPTFVSHRVRLAELERKFRLPCIYATSPNPEAGGLMSYGVNSREMFRRGARYVALILKGSNPGDLPVEQATQFELVINLATANALGITVPPALLIRADRVIE